MNPTIIIPELLYRAVPPIFVIEGVLLLMTGSFILAGFGVLAVLHGAKCAVRRRQP